jgi:Uma2 family endonuclease
MAQPALPFVPTPPAADNIITLSGATWADYQRVLELRGDRSVPRVAYLEGRLELMNPSLSHEAIKSMIGCLVEAWCLERGVEITPYGSWTHESKASSRGVEPDECYVLGDNVEPERCDLAIEVIWTSGGLDKLEIYRKLGVREVWIWKEGALSLFELEGEQYNPIGASGVLAGIDLDQLLGFIEVRPMTRAVRQYRAALLGERGSLR